MTKKELELPQIKKKLSSFLISEEGKISKKSLLRLSASLALATIVSAGHVAAGCGCGCGAPAPRGEPCAAVGGGGCGGAGGAGCGCSGACGGGAD